MKGPLQGEMGGGNAIDRHNCRGGACIIKQIVFNKSLRGAKTSAGKATSHVMKK